jgi:hypothetical protein
MSEPQRDDEVRGRREAKAAAFMATLGRDLGVPKDIGVETIVRYGTHEDASLAILLTNGATIHFERQADLFSPKIVMRRAALAGCDIKHLSGPATLTLAKRIIAQADLLAELDIRADERAMLRRFLIGAENGGTNIAANLNNLLARYEKFREVRDHDPLDDGHTPPAALAIVLTDTSTGDRYVRVNDLGRFMRHETKAAIAWPTLHSLVIRAGWRHPGELWQREPGTQRRARINVYLVPRDWEVSDLPDTDSENDAEAP